MEYVHEGQIRVNSFRIFFIIVQNHKFPLGHHLKIQSFFFALVTEKVTAYLNETEASLTE